MPPCFTKKCGKCRRVLLKSGVYRHFTKSGVYRHFTKSVVNAALFPKRCGKCLLIYLPDSEVNVVLSTSLILR